MSKKTKLSKSEQEIAAKTLDEANLLAPLLALALEEVSQESLEPPPLPFEWTPMHEWLHSVLPDHSPEEIEAIVRVT